MNEANLNAGEFAESKCHKCGWKLHKVNLESPCYQFGNDGKTAEGCKYAQSKSDKSFYIPAEVEK